MARKKWVSVRVRCINRATKEYFDRDFWLDLSTVPDGERERIEKIAKPGISPADFLQLRPFLNDGSWPDGFRAEDFDGGSSFCVADYFEDESGKPLDMIGLAQIMTGQEYPVLLHDVRSVLRLGPTGMCRKEQWCIESANALAHFFQLVEVIGAGEWLNSKLSINTPSSGEWINSFECPDLAHVSSVLLLIRQLYAEDEAFNHACKVYLRFVNDERKRWWIEETKRNFNAYLGSVPAPHAIDDFTVRELLDLVIYGAGLVHYRKSDPQTKQNFKDAVARNKREWVIFNFLSCCHQVYGHANHVYFVIRQDFEQWVSSEGCEKPDLHFLKGLFASRRLGDEDVA